MIGTSFYTYKLDVHWSKGFYMAVNVGYSIGWGYPREDAIDIRMFSIVYVLVGIAGVATALGLFAQSIIASSKHWYSKATAQAKFAKATRLTRMRLWVKLHHKQFQIIGLWLAWVVLMIIFALWNIERWDFPTALYFAVSSLSTGGLWAIPSDSPDWYFGVGK